MAPSYDRMIYQLLLPLLLELERCPVVFCESVKRYKDCMKYHDMHLDHVYAYGTLAPV